MSLHFDAIIIGTGQAGPFLAARFATAGKTVPTKTLVASAYDVGRRGSAKALIMSDGFTPGFAGMTLLSIA